MSDFSCSFFGLSQAPFTKEVSDADLWLPPSKQSVLEHLVEALQGRHSVLLVGEPALPCCEKCASTGPRHASMACWWRPW